MARFALTEANYDAAIELLKQRFQKDVIVKRSHQNELLKTKVVYNETDLMRTRSLFDKIKTDHRILAAVGADEEKYSAVGVPSLFENCPSPGRDPEYEDWKLNDLTKHLKVELELREKHQSLRPPRKDLPQSSESPYPKKPGPGTSSTLYVRQKQSQKLPRSARK